MKRILFLLFVACGFAACSDKGNGGGGEIPPPQPPATTQFAKGADVGWLTEMEAEGKKFYHSFLASCRYGLKLAQ
jgi:arabinogalactan endo-1,4-beta-galactosidase